MELAMIGLGRMGANMAQRLLRGGHRVVGYDPQDAARKSIEQKGGDSAASLEALVAKLKAPRIVWLMLPAGEVTDSTITALTPLLAAGDTIIDGGNSNYRDTQRRARTVAARRIHYVDSGTSGGVWGLAEGYSLMIGGEEEAVEHLRPIFETLAPAPNRGWGRVGAVGSGHYTKMVHNGIEYGLMQAYAEGFSILKHKSEFDLDLHQIAEIWRYGSVVRSWLLELTADALAKNPTLHGIAPYVADSGEGRWTAAEAIELGVPAFVIAASLFGRFGSQDSDSFSDKLLAAMRNQFGGHAVKTE
ncbi:MAG TPA: decarboxylating 6-phosphogluconate dehydrogenase [Steroidobacteraceae bacterium]|nr:decarboxylating 6-phosphogluconate dehydrogenase [Steroidobacteraceae bacterium]